MARLLVVEDDPDVRDLISMHVFVGMLLVPFVTVKIASTGYRFVRYYRGDVAYTRKGPPPLPLRLLGPVVVVTTIALLGTGVAALLVRGQGSWLLPAPGPMGTQSWISPARCWRLSPSWSRCRLFRSPAARPWRPPCLLFQSVRSAYSTAWVSWGWNVCASSSRPRSCS